jgi:hypothetical protein
MSATWMRRMAAVVLAFAVAAGAEKSANVELELHSVLPLGHEIFTVYPDRHTLYLMAAVESPEIEGWKVINDGGRRRVQDAKGKHAQFFPRTLSFRVTATAMRPGLLIIPQQPLGLETDTPLNDYLLNLNFRLKIFRGLKVTELAPASVRMIGMPADVPQEERVYRVGFELADVPTRDRIVLEVLSPQGERVCKFHLDLE